MHIPGIDLDSRFLFALFFLTATVATAAPTPPVPDTITPARPLWELGVFSFVARVPDYPAAEQARHRILTLPALIYRGRILRSDRRRGARLQLIESEEVHVDISAAAAFPLSSEKNLARNNMPSLDWLLELGPRLVFPLQEHQGWLTELRLPLRGAASLSQYRLDFEGLRFAPNLFSRKEFFPYQTDVFLRLTVNFINREYAKLYYGVDPIYAMEERPEFRARGGYLGSQFTAFVQKRFAKIRIFTGIEYQSFRGSTNSESPLFRQDDHWVGLLGGLWIFYKSHDLAP